MPTDRLSATFQALADPTRRAILARLALGEGPYLRVMTAEPASFARITKADIEAWRRDILVRDGVVITAGGPLDGVLEHGVVGRATADHPADRGGVHQVHVQVPGRFRQPR